MISEPIVSVPTLVVRVTSPAELSGPVVVRLRLLAIVSGPEPVFVKLARVTSWLVPVSVAPPTELPVNVAAAMLPAV